jgi:hypothetical protein
MRDSPFALQLSIPLFGQRLAASYNPADCIAFLQRLIARQRSAAQNVFDPAASAAVFAEVERLEKLLALVEAELPPRPRGATEDRDPRPT